MKMQWFAKKNDKPGAKPALPEKLRYSRYYEHDGALRAYANRAMVLAYLCVPTTFIAVALAAYVRLQPPTVIRIDGSGQAVEVAGKAAGMPVNIAQGASSNPTDFEKAAFVRLFLQRYLSFSPDGVSRSWADALNMMTANLRRSTLATLERDNIVGKIQDEQITSVFQLRSVESSKDDPLAFTAFGVKEVHRVRDHQETTDKLVGEVHIRLITERRSEENPSGLLIANYGERLIESERKEATAESAISK
jgi:hypothetical protein